MLQHRGCGKLPVPRKAGVSDLRMLLHRLLQAAVDGLTAHDAQPDILRLDACIQVKQIIILQGGNQEKMESVVQFIEIRTIIGRFKIVKDLGEALDLCLLYTSP